MDRDIILKVAQYAKECAEDESLYENEAFAQIANSLFRQAGSDERAHAPYNDGTDYVEEE